MAELVTSAGPASRDALPGSASPAATNGRAPLRHVLEFEKPLARLEQQIYEIEAMQAEKATDYTKELRQLRTNYTTLLRKTYDNLSAWETVLAKASPSLLREGKAGHSPR